MTSSDRIKLYPAKPEKVYFFATCLVDVIYPEAGLSGIELLEHAGIEVIYPADQTCCGQPPYSSGYMDESRAVATKQLALFPEPWPIVVPAGSCAGMMHRHYPELFAGTPLAEQAEQIARRTWELTDFLVNVCHLQLQDRGQPRRVALHTSCTARREMGAADAGPALLRQLQQVELVEQARPTECCGFGGTFAVRHAEVSGAMVEDKLQALEDSGAEHFVTTDCGCLMNIDGHAEHKGSPVRGQHILSFLKERCL